jgi:hypothetical protein
MYDIREQVLLPNYWEHLSTEGRYQFSDRHRESVTELVKELIFWGEAMKEARAKRIT